MYHILNIGNVAGYTFNITSMTRQVKHFDKIAQRYFVTKDTKDKGEKRSPKRPGGTQVMHFKY